MRLQRSAPLPFKGSIISFCPRFLSFLHISLPDLSLSVFFILAAFASWRFPVLLDTTHHGLSCPSSVPSSPPFSPFEHICYSVFVCISKRENLIRFEFLSEERYRPCQPESSLLRSRTPSPVPVNCETVGVTWHRAWAWGLLLLRVCWVCAKSLQLGLISLQPHGL